MKKTLYLLMTAVLLSTTVEAQNYSTYAIPAAAPSGQKWVVKTNMSDDFNYTFNATNNAADIGGTGKWKNFFHNPWTGPGPTIWRRDAASVSGGNLRLKASRVSGEVKAPYTYATRMGCISSYNKVKFPCFAEARVFVMDSQLATNVWLLSPSSPSDDQEIDIIECYGGKGANNNNAFFADRIHLSHHAFKKPGPPVLDYQPSDLGSWWRRNDVTNAAATDPLKGQWGGRWVRVGVYWVSGNEWRYFVDGVHVRTVKFKAFQTKNINNVWEYRYPYFNANGSISKTGGYQNVKTATSLNAAIAASTFNVIDPYNNMNNNYQITKEMEIIINQEDQSWQADAGRSPSNTEITNATKNTMLVDWVRVYTLASTSKFGEEITEKEAIEDTKDVGIYPNPASNVINVLAFESNTISIFNANGVKVMEKIVPFGYYQQVDISELNKGIYFVQNGSTTTKLVVNK